MSSGGDGWMKKRTPSSCWSLEAYFLPNFVTVHEFFKSTGESASAMTQSSDTYLAVLDGQKKYLAVLLYSRTLLLRYGAKRQCIQSQEDIEIMRWKLIF